MRLRKRYVGAAIAAAVLAAGAAAFTASNTLPAASVTKGYGSQTITGVTAESVTYNTNVSGDTITSVGLVLTGDTTSKDIQIAFNDAAPATCSGTGLYVVLTNDTTYDCTVNQSTAGANKFALIAED